MKSKYKGLIIGVIISIVLGGTGEIIYYYPDYSYGFQNFLLLSLVLAFSFLIGGLLGDFWAKSNTIKEAAFIGFLIGIISSVILIVPQIILLATKRISTPGPHSGSSLIEANPAILVVYIFIICICTIFGIIGGTAGYKAKQINMC